jgi:hypothetical protein
MTVFAEKAFDTLPNDLLNVRSILQQANGK